MAGIGRWPVPIPDKVKVSQSGAQITVQGPKGKLEYTCDPEVAVQVETNQVTVTRHGETNRAKAVHGMTRRLIANMVEGVSKGFTSSLEISGVGYRAEVKGNALHCTLGYSHPIVYQLPPGVQAKVERQTQVTFEGIDKQLLGEVAAGFRRLRPPEPYQGKGIKYAEEKVRRKAGKTAAGAR